jgi:hypothetical protein
MQAADLILVSSHTPGERESPKMESEATAPACYFWLPSCGNSVLFFLEVFLCGEPAQSSPILSILTWPRDTSHGLIRGTEMAQRERQRLHQQETTGLLGYEKRGVLSLRERGCWRSLVLSL